MNNVKLKTSEVRHKTIKLSCESGAGHLAPSLSTVEILVVLFNEFLKYDIDNTCWDERDRLIFSKGHGAYAYYVILNLLGIISDHDIDNFYTDSSSLKGCVCMDKNYMLEASTGSLGHGLPIAVGMAWSFKIQNKQNKVICIVGDGEMQEGSNFEALQFAYRHKLDNLLVIVDGNKLQAMDFVEDVALDNKTLYKILCNYTVKRNCFNIDGHKEDLLHNAYSFFYNNNNDDGFTLLFCNTIKGKGLAMSEKIKNYHCRCPIDDGFILKEEL